MNFENEILFYDNDKEYHEFLNYQRRPYVVYERVDRFNKRENHNFKVRFWLSNEIVLEVLKYDTPFYITQHKQVWTYYHQRYNQKTVKYFWKTCTICCIILHTEITLKHQCKIVISITILCVKKSWCSIGKTLFRFKKRQFRL